MRIITGTAKGRTIKVPKHIKPTKDSVRQAVFSTLYGLVENARVLDLFAGSGAYGLEALSRGARHVTFVDNDRNCTETIRENLKAMGLGGRGGVVKVKAQTFVERYSGLGKRKTESEKRKVTTQSSKLLALNCGFTLYALRSTLLSWIPKQVQNDKSEQSRGNSKFDIIFLDPPYSSGPQIHLLKSLAQILAPRGIIIFEHAKKTKLPEEINGLKIIRQRPYGATAISILSHPRARFNDLNH